MFFLASQFLSKEYLKVVYDKGKIKFETNDKIATLNDVGSSIHQQLVLTVEWAKSLGEFRGLPLDDQVSFLNTFNILTNVRPLFFD